MHWLAITLCVLALALDLLSRMFPILAYQANEVQDGFSRTNTGILFARGRFGTWYYDLGGGTYPVRPLTWCIPWSNPSPWSPFEKPEFTTKTIHCGGFHYSSDHTQYGARARGVTMRIPFYFLWLPTLPFAVWIIVKHFRNRKQRQAKGFEPIVS